MVVVLAVSKADVKTVSSGVGPAGVAAIESAISRDMYLKVNILLYLALSVFYPMESLLNVLRLPPILDLPAATTGTTVLPSFEWVSRHAGIDSCGGVAPAAPVRSGVHTDSAHRRYQDHSPQPLCSLGEFQRIVESPHYLILIP